jgi:hypothetical protein
VATALALLLAGSSESERGPLAALKLLFVVKGTLGPKTREGVMSPCTC